MLITKRFTSNETRKHFYIILFLSLSMIKLSYCQTPLPDPTVPNDDGQTEQEQFRDPFSYIDSCSGNMPNLRNGYCFTNIILFEQNSYEVNNFAKNSNEDILIQFSENTNYRETSSSRLFYGLAKNGSYYFSKKSSYSHEFNVDIDVETFYENEFYYLNPLRDSKNLFVSIRNTQNKGNQYLFSINSYNSMVELYDLNHNNKYYIWSFNKFFNLDPDDYFFPLDYELFELKERNEYIIVFIPKIYVYEEILDVNLN